MFELARNSHPFCTSQARARQLIRPLTDEKPSAKNRSIKDTKITKKPAIKF